MIIDNTTHLKLEQRFLHLSNHCLALLENEVVKTFHHFIHVNALEIAAELFVLSAIEKGLQFAGAQRRELLGLSPALGLDRETVKRSDYWQIASAYPAG